MNTKYVSYSFSKREITMQLNMGGFEGLERADVDSMDLGGYLPESPDENACFGYAINGSTTGFEWYWADMPKSFQNKLWHAGSA